MIDPYIQIKFSDLYCTCSTPEHPRHYDPLRIFTLDKNFKQTYLANPEYPHCSYLKYSCPRCRKGFMISTTKLLERYIHPTYLKRMDVKALYRDYDTLTTLYMRFILDKVESSKSPTFACKELTKPISPLVQILDNHPNHLCLVTVANNGKTSTLLISPDKLPAYLNENLRPDMKIQLELIKGEDDGN